MNMNVSIEKLEKARVIAQSLNRKIWKMRAGGHAPSVGELYDSQKLANLLDETYQQFLDEQEHLSRIQEGMGIEPLNEQDHQDIGF